MFRRNATPGWWACACRSAGRPAATPTGPACFVFVGGGGPISVSHPSFFLFVLAGLAVYVPGIIFA